MLFGFNGDKILLKYRLISTFVLIPLVLMALFLLSPIWFTITILVISILAGWEWGELSCLTVCTQWIWLVLLSSLLVGVIFFLFLDNQQNLYEIFVSSALWVSLSWWITSFLLICFYPYSTVLWRKSTLLHLIFGLLIIVPFFLSMLLLRIWCYNDNQYSGALSLLYVMILVWSNDSGAYIFGKLFGKHQLVPNISPSKTWQGFIGGLFTAVIMSWNYGILVDLEVAPTTLLTAIVIALAAVLGDLTESMFKRAAGIKDSGYIIPGHGGILDRIDSLMAAVPVFACLLLLVYGRKSLC